MTDLLDKSLGSNSPGELADGSVKSDQVGSGLELKSTHDKTLKASFLATLFTSTLSVFEPHSSSSSVEKKVTKPRGYSWAASLKRAASSGPMRRFQERWLGTSRSDALNSTSEIWFLGKSYMATSEEPSAVADSENSYSAFVEDYTSRVWITYRKGFEAIHDTKFTSDASWGCMIRSSQMLVAQALIFHHLGRSWRRPLQKPYDPRYIEILHLFGDSQECAFSLHNLIQAGRSYNLAAGSWLGPYAMCRTWETLARTNAEQADRGKFKESLPMAIYVVSGDEDGERGGAPVICIDTICRICSDFNKGLDNWAPILLLVPLVLGLDKVNPRYIPLLRETFVFPQSLGILGGKPGASTYIVGVQDDKGIYLDPHEVQPAIDIKSDNLEADASSYHCSTIRSMALDVIDPSLAIGFYCRDKDDFEDFCSRSTQLGDKSNGAPLFTIVKSHQTTKLHPQHDASADNLGGSGNGVTDSLTGNINNNGDNAFDGDDEWQLL